MENYKVSNEYDGKLRTLYHKKCRCGKDFWVPKHVFEKRKYCNKFCPQRKNESKQITLLCRLCGKEFKRYVLKLTSSVHGVYFCSRICKDIGQCIKSGIDEIQPNHYGNAIACYRDKLQISECISC